MKKDDGIKTNPGAEEQLRNPSGPPPWRDADVEEKLERVRAAIKYETQKRVRFESMVLEKLELLEQHTHSPGMGGKMVVPYEQTRRRIPGLDMGAQIAVEPGKEYF